MQIPVQYRGRWSGEITDTTRKNPYQGQILLAADSVETTYFMARGKNEGKLTLLCEADGFLVLEETTASFTGTLLLYLDAGNLLKCVWRCGSKFNSEATMTPMDALQP